MKHSHCIEQVSATRRSIVAFSRPPLLGRKLPVLRQAPKAGAVCGNSVRTDHYGGMGGRHCHP